MGRLIEQVMDPELIDLPNDIDFDEEGIDSSWGEYLEYEAFLPDAIADMKPLTPETVAACKRAQAAIDTIAALELPNVVTGPVAELLLYDEAVSTTQVENYPTTCAKMLEANAVRSAATCLPLNEQVAIDAVDALRDFTRATSPLTVDALCDINASFTRHSDRAEYCGVLRERPVWIGGANVLEADYVAPPADYIEDYIEELVAYVNSDTPNVPAIAKAAIAHAQFVNIHPFEDGNGRCGRALAQYVLEREGATTGLSLPTTSYIALVKPAYVAAIQEMRNIRAKDDPNQMVQFFADCCENAAVQARVLARKTERTLDKWTKALPTHDIATKRAIEALATTPVMTRSMLDASGASTLAIDTLMDAGILTKRHSQFMGTTDVYIAQETLNILEEAQQQRRRPLQANLNVAQALEIPLPKNEDPQNPETFSFI